MLLIIGLGNPGKKYQLTRHNAGQIILDHLFPRAIWQENKKLKALISKSPNFILAKPLVFMNEVGQVITGVKNYFRAPIEKILLIHDDSDIELGKYKLQNNRFSAGHKGVDSAIQHLGTQNFWRLRVGIRPENNSWPAEKLVLKKFSPNELARLNELAVTKNLIKAIIEKL